MSKVKTVICPHCNSQINIRKKIIGRVSLSLGSSVLSGSIGSTLGIAGAIFSFPIAIPATLAGVAIGGIIGYSFGKKLDSNFDCPVCKMKVKI
ncbi:MAG: hypothetical protein QXD05_00090 [Candidatus Pacearchaeota archaeon]